MLAYEIYTNIIRVKDVMNFRINMEIVFFHGTFTFDIKSIR